MARHCEFTPEVGNKICARLAAGESMREIARDDDMPDASTVYRWLLREDMQPFREQYTQAREAQADAIFDEIIEIADDGTNDWMEKRLSSGETIEALNAEHVQRSRLRVDARKWVAARLAPKKYGDKIDVTSGGDKIQREVSETEMVTRLAAIAAQRNEHHDESSD